VERDHGPLAEEAESFYTTRWTIVMRAAQSQAPWGQSALAELCRLYWFPLYTFARRRGRSPEDAPSYEEVASRLQVTIGAVKTHIHRLRKRYTALLCEEVGRTVSDPAEIDEEIHALCEALIASERRLGP